MEYPNCKECAYNGKCACQHWNLDIKYCQFKEVDEHPYKEEE